MARTADPLSQKHLAEAARVALQTSQTGVGGPFGALIVDPNGRVIGRASNTVLRDNNPTRHAEMNAIEQACRRLRSPFLDGCVVYSTTEPCPMCFSALHWARAKRVVYATTIKDVKRLGFNELSIPNAKMKRWGKSPLLIKRVQSDACKRLLAAWAKNGTLKTY